MRWNLDLASPTILADGGKLRLTDGHGRSAVIQISLRRGWLEFDCLAKGPAVRLRPAYPEWYNRGHIVVLLNPGHDHATQWQFAVTDDGTVSSKAEWFVAGEEPADKFVRELPALPKASGKFQQLDDRRFRVKLRLPAAAIWPAGAIVAGLTIKVGFHEECIPAPLCWPAEVPELRGPITFGDLYRQASALQINRITISRPAWGLPGRLIVHGSASGKARPVRAQVGIILPGEGEQAMPEVSFDAGSQWRASLPVVFPHRAKWASNIQDIARLSLTLADEKGKPIWQGQYPFGFDSDIIVREKYGPFSNRRQDRPEPSDSDFVEKFRRYILSGIPDYRPGGPVGLFLEDPSGKAHLDLLRDDWPARLVKMLAQRFGRWDDALCAVSMWIYHPLVTRHSPSWARLTAQVKTLSIPRMCGAYCDSTARLGAMLAEKLGRHMGVKLTGYTAGLRGHILTMVQSPAGQVIVDGMLGLWFHTLDNRRLATLSEMRQDRRIVERMWWCTRSAQGHEFFFGTHNQMIRPWEDGSLEWP